MLLYTTFFTLNIPFLLRLQQNTLRCLIWLYSIWNVIRHFLSFVAAATYIIMWLLEWMPGLSSNHVLHRKILCWSAPLLTVCFYICIFIKESFYFLLHILYNISTKSRNIHKYSCHLTTTNIRPIQLYVNYNREGTDRYFVRAFVVCIRVYVCICISQP